MVQNTKHDGLKLTLLGSPRLDATAYSPTTTITKSEIAQLDYDSPLISPVKISRRKSFAMLAYLAMNHKPSRREALMTLLWPDAEPTLAYSYLR